MLVSMVTPFEPLLAVWLSWSIMLILVSIVFLTFAKAGMPAVAEVLSVHQRMVARIMLRRLVSRFCIFYLVSWRISDFVIEFGTKLRCFLALLVMLLILILVLLVLILILLL